MPGDRMRGNNLYEHLGIASSMLDEDSGETTMRVTDEIRHPGGLRIAPLGLAFENGAFVYAFRKVSAVPIQITIRQRDRGAGVSAIRSVSRLVRLGRSILVTGGDIHDADDSSRLIAFGSIVWSVVAEPAPRSDLAPPPAWEPEGWPVLPALGIEPLGDGSGCRLETVTPATSGPGGILHAGMMQFLSEEAALVVARRATGSALVAVADAAYHFLQPGRGGPFVAQGEVLASTAGLDVAVELRDQGQDGRVCSLSYLRVVTED